MDQTKRKPSWQSVFRPNLFLGKVALVTGGGTGIGRAIALELATLGAITVIASRDGDKCKLASEEMNRQLLNDCKGKIVVGPGCSIRNEEDVEQLVSKKQREERKKRTIVNHSVNKNKKVAKMAFHSILYFMFCNSHLTPFICIYACPCPL
jgi:Dehydrogenases with different specificities (related to short-chain alcohol dehydrogenases)